MTTRRNFLASLTASAAGIALSRPFFTPALAATKTTDAETLETRLIPSTGERLPVIGMGSSGSFDVGAAAAERDPLREVLRRFLAGGGTVIDTAPSYGRSEAVIGDLLAEASLRPKVFLATKISSTGREAGLAQFRRSLDLLKTEKVDLLQVHNLQDWRTQVPLIQELKAEGRTRYIGLTHWQDRGHDDLAEVVEATKPDFLQVNYSVISQGAERRLFPLAQNLGTAVLINRAFDDGRLFTLARGKELPPWAAEVGITSWAQAFLKFALSHPAVTVVIPATSRPDRQSDNLKAGTGPTLTKTERQSLIALFA